MQEGRSSASKGYASGGGVATVAWTAVDWSSEVSPRPEDTVRRSCLLGQELRDRPTRQLVGLHGIQSAAVLLSSTVKPAVEIADVRVPRGRHCQEPRREAAKIDAVGVGQQQRRG